jgi:putative endonuclease
VKAYYVYILSNKTKMLYTGVTNHLLRRVLEHKQKLIPGYSRLYNFNRLVYYEETSDVHAAIARDKEIKGWLRAKKVALIEGVNPEWADLSQDWYDPESFKPWRSLVPMLIPHHVVLPDRIGQGRQDDIERRGAK